jgi:D-xylonolactonase
MYRYDPASGEHEQVYEGEPVGGFTIQADGALLLFGARGAVRTWREGTIETIIAEIPADRESRFNDVFADPAGRVFCGTMGSRAGPGRLYRLDPDGRLTVVREGIRCPNGMGLTPDGRRLYFTDTMERKILLADYDQATGELDNWRLFAQVAPEDGLPDGMTVDAAGYVWSARWNGWCLARHAPDGSEEGRITFPARQVSCPTFGGEDYADLYVTTAGGDDKAENGSGAGALFRLRLPGISGVPEHRSRVGL